MKYYDEMCTQCRECGYCEEGLYQDGKTYKACRCYGYILHPHKGISEEPCPGFRTPEQVREQRALASQKATKTKKRR